MSVEPQPVQAPDLLADLMTPEGDVMIRQAAITVRRAKRGAGDGHVWWGKCLMAPDCPRRPLPGESLHVRLDGRSTITAVVTEVVENTVHFRARGKLPGPG